MGCRFDAGVTRRYGCISHENLHLPTEDAHAPWPCDQVELQDLQQRPEQRRTHHAHLAHAIRIEQADRVFVARGSRSPTFLDKVEVDGLLIAEGSQLVTDRVPTGANSANAGGDQRKQLAWSAARCNQAPPLRSGLLRCQVVPVRRRRDPEQTLPGCWRPRSGTRASTLRLRERHADLWTRAPRSVTGF